MHAIRRAVRRFFWDGESYPVRAKVMMALAGVCGPAGAFGVVNDPDLSVPVKLLGLIVALAWSMVAAVVLAELIGS